MAKSKIISFDGGGIRGILSITLIERLREEFPGLLDKTTMYCGTSTGGIIALALAKGIPPSQIKQLYYAKGKQIFKRNYRHFLGLFGAKFKSKFLREELRKIFENTKLRDLDKRILVPAFDLDNEKNMPDRTWKPKFFTNFGTSDPDGDVPVLDVAMATSAAPTYFPTYDGYIDGGVIANNPSDSAIIELMNTGDGEGEVGLKNITLLSLGTGRNAKWIEGQNFRWGAAKWAPHLIDILVEGVNGVNHHHCKHLLRKRYHRIDPVLRENIDLADWKKAQQLVENAEAVDLSGTVEWLKEYWG